jgi:outer membrane immunogenic protein
MAIATSFIRASLLAGTTLLATQAMAEPFNGPYVGAQLGWQQDKFKATAGAGIDTLTGSDKSNGFSYGAVLGYDYNINGNGIIGLEGTVGGATNKLRDGASGTELRSGRTIELAARAGALISKSTLIYARGGWSNARFTVPVELGNFSSTRNGWVAGVGIEQALSQNISARVEYDYSQYSRLRGTLDLGEGTAPYSIRPSRNAIKAGVSFHF